MLRKAWCKVRNASGCIVDDGPCTRYLYRKVGVLQTDASLTSLSAIGALADPLKAILVKGKAAESLPHRNGTGPALVPYSWCLVG